MHYSEDLAPDITTLYNCFKVSFFIYFVCRSLSMPVDFYVTIYRRENSL